MRLPLRRIIASAVVLALAGLCWAQAATEARRAPAQFSADAYLGHIKYLASDELGGRGVGTDGIEKAATYIAEQLKAGGCEPGGVDGTWFQPFEVAVGKKIVEEDARLEVDGLNSNWKVRQDWIPLPFSAPEAVDAPLAFAGYGIQAERYDYDDYQGFDATGKVLLIFRYEPPDPDPQAKFGGQTPSRHALFARKIRLAARQGAKALLIVDPPSRDPQRDELYEFDMFASQQTYELPIVHVRRAVADAILKQAGMVDSKTLQEKLDQDRKPLSKDLGLSVRLNPGLQPNLMQTKNVLGLIRGNGQTQETIVVGAHYDHLGTGLTPLAPAASQPIDAAKLIYHGADDNASGTAGVIELARAIKSGPPLRRNVVFIAFSGEELGLLGSRHFVENPTVALSDIRAMVNMDMIGRLNRNSFAVFGVSTASELVDLVKQAAEGLGLDYKPRGAVGGSDHVSFERHQIPAVFFFTGADKTYHQPEDTWQLIDASGATKVLQMVHALVAELADLEGGPTFTEPARESEEELLARPAAEEQREAVAKSETAEDTGDDSNTPPRGEAVRLGIQPDVAGDGEPGMKVVSVVDGGCAKAAGLQDGDRIIKIGAEQIRDVYGYMRVLKQFKPGDEVEIVVLRAGEQKTFKVTLEGSKRRGGGND